MFICIDGVSGLEDGAKAIFKDVVVQRCIVHLIRNSIKYVPKQDVQKIHTKHKESVLGAPSLTASRKAYEQFCQEWSQYPGAVDAKTNFNHVEQLFDYGSAVRRCIQPMRLKA